MLRFHHEEENSDPFMAGEHQLELNYYDGLVYYNKKIKRQV